MRARRGFAAIVSAAIVVVMAAACSPSARVSSCPNVLYLSLNTDGTILIDGETVPMDGVAQKVQSLKSTAKYVVYYREDAQAKPSYARLVQIEAVLTEVAKLHLPLSLSSKPDFSDTLDAQGKSQPRTACPGQA